MDSNGAKVMHESPRYLMKHSQNTSTAYSLNKPKKKPKQNKTWEVCLRVCRYICLTEPAFISLDKSEFLDEENNNAEQVLFVTLNFCVTK